MYKIRKLDAETCRKYFEELSVFYYNNSIVGSCEYGFTMEKAKEKIEGMISYLEEGKAVTYGAFDEDKIIGYAWAYVYPFRQEERIYFNEMHVLDEYRSHGIGSQFLQCIENEGRERSLPATYLHGQGHNEKAIKLYLRKGYEIERLQFRKAL